jgi:hypothetical protein
LQWIEAFGSHGGPQLILQGITGAERDCQVDKSKQQLLYEFMRCFVALLRSKQGKQMMLGEGRDGLKRVILCLDPKVSCFCYVLLLEDFFLKKTNL